MGKTKKDLLVSVVPFVVSFLHLEEQLLIISVLTNAISLRLLDLIDQHLHLFLSDLIKVMILQISHHLFVSVRTIDIPYVIGVRIVFIIVIVVVKSVQELILWI